MDFLRIFVFVTHALISVALIVLVVIQTSRSEGLGPIGGSSSSPILRGRQGVEEKLAEYTKYVAFAFMSMSFLAYMLSMKFGWS